MVAKYYNYEELKYVSDVPFKNEEQKDISEFVNEIIAKRKAKAPNIKAAIEKVAARIAVLESFIKGKTQDFSDPDKVKEQFAAIIPSKDLDVFVENLKKITDDELNETLSCLKATKVLLEDAYKRFSKDDICISLVGPARIGKSSFIQSVTGVSDKICPSSPEGEPCTGVCSIIRNRDQNKTTAVFTYYTPEEFKQIFEDYKLAYINSYKKNNPSLVLKLKGLSFSKEGFGKLYDLIDKNTDYLGYKIRIKEYYENFDHIMELISEVSYTTDDENEIEKKVAQKVGDRRYYDFLAVKKAEIYTRFVATDVKNLTLIDTIGLGELSLYVEKNAVETVAYESDFVILLNKVSNDKTYNQINNTLRDCINKVISGCTIDDSGEVNENKVGLQKVDSNKWAFAVYNPCHIDENNPEHKNIVPDFSKGFEATFTDFAAYVDAKCISKDELKERVIEPALLYINNNLSEIDEWFEDSITASVNTANKNWSVVAGKIATADISDANITTAIQTHATEKATEVQGAFHKLIDEEYNEVPASETINKINDMVDSIESFIDLDERSLPLIAIINSYSATKKNIESAFKSFGSDVDKICTDEKIKLFERVKEITGLGKGLSYSNESDTFKIFSDLYLNKAVQADLVTAFANISQAEINMGNILAVVNQATSEFLDPHAGTGNIPTYWNSENISKNIEKVLKKQVIKDIKEKIKASKQMESPEAQIYNAIRSFLHDLCTATQIQWIFLYSDPVVANDVFKNELAGVDASVVNVGNWKNLVTPVIDENGKGSIVLW